MSKNKATLAEVIEFPLQSYLPNGDINVLKSKSEGGRLVDFEGCVYGQISDDSLTNARIYKDEWVVINLNEAVKNGDLIVIQESTGKLFIGFVRFIGGGKFQLDSANKGYKSIIYTFSETKIVGRVVRVERDLI